VCNGKNGEPNLWVVADFPFISVLHRVDATAMKTSENQLKKQHTFLKLPPTVPKQQAGTKEDVSTALEPTATLDFVPKRVEIGETTDGRLSLTVRGLR
jgi:hypothetical protein